MVLCLAFISGLALIRLWGCKMKVYCLLIVEDTSVFCHKVIKVFVDGWEFYGSLAYGYDVVNGIMCCAQVVIKDVLGVDYIPDVKFG